jgi:heavy metal sensor kinase
MSALRRLPIRVRLTLAFAAGTALILVGVGVFVYARMGADLLAATDAGLSAQADALVPAIRARGSTLGQFGFGFRGSEEAFAQLADAGGRILESTPVVARAPLLSAGFLRSVTRRSFVDRQITGVDDVARLLVEPVEASGQRFVLVVGTSLQDRKDALVQLAALLGIGGPIALALTSLAAWLLAGALLRPVEQMRSEADAISVSEPDRRLPVPDREDELARLGRTLNSMLERLNASFERERRFLDDASHELRTPLTVLKAELELALLRDRTPEELRATVGQAAEETDRVVRLAEDLLVLSRANRGRLEIHREETQIQTLVHEACERYRSRAQRAAVKIEMTSTEDRVSLDPLRIRQALDNLLDNALRHTPPGGVIRIGVSRDDGTIRLVVEDSGSGFPPDFLSKAFEPFSRGPDPERNGSGGAGLGLAIVQAIAQGHGGWAFAENRPEGGSRLTLMLRDA